MQKLEPRKIITLGTGEKYLVISEAELEGKSYYYITEVNEMETETKENLRGKLVQTVCEARVKRI